MAAQDTSTSDSSAPQSDPGDAGSADQADQAVATARSTNTVHPGVPVPEHVGAGRLARKIVPRKSLADWNPATRGHDALQTILAQNEIRDQRLLPIRHGRMAASPWTYYRGAAAVMAADLASSPHTDLTVQLCGDAHVLNFGLWNTPERNLAFDLRDFDETLAGPFEWDLKRFLASLVVLGGDNNIPAKRVTKAIEAGYRGYRTQIGEYAHSPILDVWYDQVEAGDLVRLTQGSTSDDTKLDELIEKQAQKRTSRGASKKLTMVVDGERRIKEKPPYRVHALSDFTDRLGEAVALYHESTPDHLSSLLSRFNAVDVVQQVVGVGSVGMRVFLMLNEEHVTHDPLFLQVKQATASVYEQHLQSSTYGNHGSRVVHGQRLIQSASDMFLGWTSVDGYDFYVRQFRDGKVIPTGEMLAPRLPQFAYACGRVLARAHARSGDARAITDYLGGGKSSTAKGDKHGGKTQDSAKRDKVAEAFISFAYAYADQNAADHAQLAKAVENGDIPSAPGWP